jgi:hypothetical protein
MREQLARPDELSGSDTGEESIGSIKGPEAKIRPILPSGVGRSGPERRAVIESGPIRTEIECKVRAG